MSELEPHILVALLAGAIGLVFGIAMEASRFCLLSGVRDQLTRGTSPKLAMFALAAAVAVLGAQGLQLAGYVDLDESIYRGDTLSLGGLVIGGLLFGVGAVLTRGCVSRLTVLSATGNLRALVVLMVVGITAYATLRGVLYFPRDLLQSATTIAAPLATLDAVFASAGFGETVARLAPALPIALLAVAYTLNVTRNPGHWIAAIVIGGAVVAGWYVTGYIGADDFDPQPVESLTFSAPVANSLLYLMTFTGSTISFGVALFAGTLIGVAVSAIAGGRMVPQSFESASQMTRYLTGGVLMGFGSVAALGCTIGQGLSGVSTLSIAAFIALGSIVTGMVLGLKLVDRVARDEGQGEAVAASV